MKSYKDILAEIEQLKLAAEEARRKEVAKAVEQARALIEQHGLTAEDLGFAVRRGTAAKKAAGKAPVAAKYRNPETGVTWSGRGRAPQWIKDAEAKGKARASFLVGG